MPQWLDILDSVLTAVEAVADHITNDLPHGRPHAPMTDAIAQARQKLADAKSSTEIAPEPKDETPADQSDVEPEKAT